MSSYRFWSERLGRLGLLFALVGALLIAPATSIPAAQIATPAATPVAPIATSQDASAHGARTFVTTVNLNLRTGPSTDHHVITVMPRGSHVVDYDGNVVNGFRGVDFHGTVGWAWDGFLKPLHHAPTEPTEPIFVGTAQTIVNSNLRAGPSTGFGVITVVPKGTWVSVSTTAQDGFRFVDHSGTRGWIHESLLGGHVAEAGPFTTTVNLNLRTGPSLDHAVILVIPAGSTVIDYDGNVVNGFRGVDYQGNVGWVWDGFLR